MKVELEDGEWKALEDLRVVDLRALLGKYDLSKTGTKPVLLKRLQTHLEEIEERKKSEAREEEKDEEEKAEEEEEVKETPVAEVEAEPEPAQETPQADSPLMLEADVNEFKDEKEVEVETERSQSTEQRQDEKAPEPAPPPAEDDSKKKDKENGEEATPIPKPSIPFRKLNKSISKEERKPRSWSDASLPGEPAEAVSTESLKDIIPDLKPLLESQTSGLEEGIEEENKPTAKREAPEEAAHDGSEEGEIPPSASPPKRPRIDPPAQPAAVSQGDETDVLLIRNLVRPFTLTQLKELLKRTGTVEDFWINKIKSHCFVRFSKVDEASETRHALDGVKWPNSNPKTLSVTFSTRKKMEETAEENTSFEATPIKNEVPKEGLKLLATKEKFQSSETKGSSVKPQLLDDLFRKTKTTPCIYWTMNEKSLKKGKEERKKVEVMS